MIDQRLFIYIEQELKRGVPNAAIKNALREAGWAEEAIGQAFIAVQSRNVPPRPVQELPAERFSPGVSKYRIIKKGGRKLPLGMIIAIVGVIVAALAGLGYAFFVAPERQEESGVLDDTAPTILKKESIDTAISGEMPEETAESLETAEADGDLIVPPTDQPAQSLEKPELSETDNGGILKDAAAAQPENMLQNDAKRKEDLGKLAAAQKLWLNDHGSYYTCGLSGGDCGGKVYGFPEQIGVYLSKTEQDPMFGDYAQTKAVCGKDYVYCGLNNASYSKFFCYYAKLESGGYYTVSHMGSAVRSLTPKVFEECGIAE